MRIGEKLRMIREANGISQEELAARLNVSIPSVSRWESGARTFPADDLERIAEALEVEASAFYTAELWGRVEEAQRKYDAVIAEVQAIFKSARDTSAAPASDLKRRATHVDPTHPMETDDSCSQAGKVLVAAGRRSSL